MRKNVYFECNVTKIYNIITGFVVVDRPKNLRLLSKTHIYQREIVKIFTKCCINNNNNNKRKITVATVYETACQVNVVRGKNKLKKFKIKK